MFKYLLNFLFSMGYSSNDETLAHMGLSDREVHAWLRESTAAVHRNRFGGDVVSVILANGWTPDRYENAMRQNIPSKSLADVFAESYRKKYNIKIDESH